MPPLLCSRDRPQACCDELWLSWCSLHAWEHAEEPDSCYQPGQTAVYKHWSFSQLRCFTAAKDGIVTCFVSICTCWENSSWEDSPVFVIPKENVIFGLQTLSEMFLHTFFTLQVHITIRVVGPRDECMFNIFQQSFPNFFSLHFTCFSPLFLTLPVKTLWNSES